MQRLAMVAAGVSAAALLGAVWYVTQTGRTDPLSSCRSTVIAGGAGTIGGPFELINAAGETVTDRDVITGPSLVYFGYTFCPDVCPLDTVRNADAADLLAQAGYEVTPVFISVDPKRDTPQVVGDFAANIHTRMIGLTGTPEQIKAAASAYRTIYDVPDTEDEFYLVGHMTHTYLMTPDKGFLEFFPNQLSAEAVAEKTACFLANS